MNENAPYRLDYLNAYFLLGRTVWEGLGDVALLEEMCHWGQAGFEVSKVQAVPS